MRKGARMMPGQDTATSRVMEPTKAGSPSHYYLDTFDAVWQYGDATSFENETASRQIGIQRSLAPLRCRVLLDQSPVEITPLCLREKPAGDGRPSRG
jgi:hypothetical protein